MGFTAEWGECGGDDGADFDEWGVGDGELVFLLFVLFWVLGLSCCSGRRRGEVGIHGITGLSKRRNFLSLFVGLGIHKATT